MKLNLGCGEDTLHGYVNLDLAPADGVDVVADLEDGDLPFQDDSFDEVLASHVLAHLQRKTFHEALVELLRILRQGGRLEVRASYFPSALWFGDPDHRIPFGWRTFDGYTRPDGRTFPSDLRRPGRLGPAFPLVMEHRWFVFSRSPALAWIGRILNLFPAVYDRFFCHWLPAEEIRYVLRVDKEGSPSPWRGG